MQIILFPEKYNQRIFAFFRYVAFPEQFDYMGHHVMKKGFAMVCIEFHIHPFVELIIIRQGFFYKIFPQRHVFTVALLKFFQLCPGFLLKIRLTSAFLREHHIEPLQFLHGIFFIRVFVGPSPECHDQFSKLRAPVTKMVVRNHIISKRCIYPFQGIPYYSAAQMPHVHLFCDVWR